ncbi:MAG: AAA family ATPase [Planctomycetia bacterium]|nr:AAA family ATPase [Planctomycetia bacterium]
MKIKSITINNFGPFYGEHKLELDPSVTVLTGPNDSGKSILLDALACTVSLQGTAERRVNITRAGEVSGSRLADQNLSAEVVFGISAECIAAKVVQEHFKPGDLVTAKRPLGSNSPFTIRGVERNGKPVGISGHFAPNWNILRLPGEAFRQIIPLTSANAVERAFLEIGLGPKFADRQERLPSRWPETLRNAEEALTDAIQRVLPSAMTMEVRLTDGAPQNAGAVRISLVDTVGELIGTEDRGAGIGRMLAFVGPLVLALREQKAPLLILIDEPENSLHADLQHRLRGLLEEVGNQPMCQVIYATHSPSMINNMRPEAIRLLSRGKIGEFPTSKIKNDPFSKNFATVRSALGITPADSLLFAPVTVVVEGKTEAYCLPRILQKLKNDSIEGFGDVNKTLDQIHFLDGEGDSVEFLVRLAKSQNAKVVVFLDGEKRPKKGEDKLASEHKDVTVIKFESGKDIEQIVPREIYFRAVAECCADNEESGASPAITQDEFDRWLASQKQRVKDNIFGRQIQDWLRVILSEPIPPKHKLMEKAIELCPSNNIDTGKLLELVRTISQSVSQSGAYPP